MTSSARPSGDAVFLSLCALLGPAHSSATAAIERLGDQEDAWIALAGLANDQRVAGYLHEALTRKQLETPYGFGDYVRVVAEANARRNSAIRAQLVAVTRHLNSVGIIPMAIKGAAFLSDTDGEVSGRMPLDIDLLIEGHRFDEAIGVLVSAGYRFSQREDRQAHARNLYHPACAAPLDIHRTFGRQRSLLQTEDVWLDALPSTLDGGQMLLPSPTHRLFHAIFHAELQNRFYSLGRISLQLLIDVANLLTRYQAIDMEAAAKPFAVKGIGYIFSSAIYATHAALGVPAHAASSVAAARRHYGRCLWQLRHPRAHWLISRAWMLGHPFGRFKVGYRYGCEDDDLRLNLMRLFVPIRMVREYRGSVLAKGALSWRDRSVMLR